MELIEGSDFLVYVGRATDEAPTDATTVAARNTAASRSETMLDVTPVPADKPGYHALLASKGIERLPNPQFQPPPSAPDRGFGQGDRFS